MNPLTHTPRSRRITAWLLLLCAGLALAACGENDRQRIEGSGIVRLATDATFAPFAWTDTSSHQVVGFDVDLAHALFGKLGYTVAVVPTTLDELVPALQFGRCDVVMSAFSVTVERQEQVLFSIPYFETELVIVVAASDSTIHGVADLVGKKVGVERGSTGERSGERIFRAEVFRYDSIGQAFRALEAGDLAAVINDRPSSALYIARGLRAKVVGDVLGHERYAAAFRRTDGWLQARFDSALVAYLPTPDCQNLLLRYGLAKVGANQPTAP